MAGATYAFISSRASPSVVQITTALIKQQERKQRKKLRQEGTRLDDESVTLKLKPEKRWFLFKP